MTPESKSFWASETATVTSDCLQHKFSADVTLVTSGGSVRCHRAVLAASSPFLRTVLDSVMSSRDDNG